jgi:hypothetical protein
MSEQAPSKDLVTRLRASAVLAQFSGLHATADDCRLAADALERASHEPRARDADLYEWVSGLVEALNLAGITRAQGEEHIDTDYLAELHSLLSQPPGVLPFLQDARDCVKKAIDGDSFQLAAAAYKLDEALKALGATPTKAGE